MNGKGRPYSLLLLLNSKLLELYARSWGEDQVHVYCYKSRIPRTQVVLRPGIYELRRGRGASAAREPASVCVPCICAYSQRRVVGTEKVSERVFC